MAETIENEAVQPKTFRQMFDDNNYIVINDFISADEAKILYQVFKKDSETDPTFTNDPQCPLSKSKYDYRWFVELLINRLPIMNELMGEPMLPTYSYARVYANGDELKKHTDRPACEVSVTLHLDSDGKPWPIWFTKPNGETVSYELQPGQAVAYYGMKSEHWREKFEGEHYGQVFLHYVRARGDHYDCYFDKKRKD